MPKAKSKAQQRLFWYKVGRKEMTYKEAHLRSVKGKRFSKLPERITKYGKIHNGLRKRIFGI